MLITPCKPDRHVMKCITAYPCTRYGKPLPGKHGKAGETEVSHLTTITFMCEICTETMVKEIGGTVTKETINAHLRRPKVQTEKEAKEGSFWARWWKAFLAWLFQTTPAKAEPPVQPMAEQPPEPAVGEGQPAVPICPGEVPRSDDGRTAA